MYSTTFTRLGIFIFSIALLFSCIKENEPGQNGGIILALEASSAINPTQGPPGGWREDIQQVKLTIKNPEGQLTTYTHTQLEMSPEGTLLVRVDLPAGEYELRAVYLEDDMDNVVYATPNTGSPLAEKTVKSLPVSFHVTAGSHGDMVMKTLSTRNSSPEDFGFDPATTIFKQCDGGSYEGDVLLQSQKDVAEFGANCYTAIKGNLRIQENRAEDPIVDLRALSSLKNISESLDIISTSSLQSLDGLQHIPAALSVSVSRNKALESLNGLNGMAKVYVTFSITSNPALTSLDGLEGFTELMLLSVVGNAVLTDFSGLDNLEKVGNLSVTSNERLVSLSGMPKLKQISELRLDSNSALRSLSGFNASITSVGSLVCSNSVLEDLKGMLAPEGKVSAISLLNNRNLSSLEGLNFAASLSNLDIRDNLQFSSIAALKQVQNVTGRIRISNNGFLRDLEGLNNLTSVGSGSSTSIEISNNRFLTNFCSLTGLFSKYTSYAPTIKSNGHNPTVEDIINGECAK